MKETEKNRIFKNTHIHVDKAEGLTKETSVCGELYKESPLTSEVN